MPKVLKKKKSTEVDDEEEEEDEETEAEESEDDSDDSEDDSDEDEEDSDESDDDEDDDGESGNADEDEDDEDESEDSPRSTVFTVNSKVMRQKAEELRRKRGGRWKPPQGASFVRVLPPWSKKGMWYKEVAQHFFSDLGLPEDAPVAMTCRRVFGKPCPICKLAESSSADRLVANERAAMNVVPCKENGKPTEGVQQWECSMSQLQDLLEYSSEDDADEHFTHPVKGRLVKIIRKGEGMGTRYKIVISRHQTKLDDYKTHLKSMKDLDKLNKEPDKASYLKVAKLLKKALSRKNMLEDDE